MKVLHLYSDWKWTGPSEPIVNLCRTLAKRGHSIWLGCLELPPRTSGTTLLKQARDNGIETFLLKRSTKLTRPITLLKNIRMVRRFLTQRAGIIHTHSSLDHFIVAKAVGKLSPRPVIIRTNHKGKPLEFSRINKWLMNKYTDGYITLSAGLLDQDRKTFGISEKRSWWVEGAIDIERRPACLDGRRAGKAGLRPDQAGIDIREKYGLDSSDVVAGVVARVQKHRRFEVLLEAMVQVIKTVPQLKVIVLGRGTRRKEILVDPLERMGLKRNVIPVGYIKDDYVDILKLMDFGIYLMPGSDGSCRAAREMMALGKPIIASRYGILPELIQDEVNGLVRTDTPKAFGEAMISMVKDRAMRERLGKAARAKALTDFNLTRQAEVIERIYEDLLIKEAI